MVLYGIEFEMVVYTNSPNGLNHVRSCMKRNGLTGHGDGSIRSSYSLGSLYRHKSKREWVTQPTDKPLEVFKKLIKDLRSNHKYKVIFNNNPKKITKNTIRIDFNDSTGTHIHYSSELIEGKTRELKYFNNIEVLKEVERYITENCKYPIIKSNMIRGFAKSYFRQELNEYDLHERYNSINVSDQKRHGTIEFRLCNLRGTNNRNVVQALRHQIKLIDKAIIKGWKLVEQEKKKELKIIKEIRKPKVIKNECMPNVSSNTTEVFNTNNQN